jgi:hypothetical protein
MSTQPERLEQLLREIFLDAAAEHPKRIGRALRAMIEQPLDERLQATDFALGTSRAVRSVLNTAIHSTTMQIVHAQVDELLAAKFASLELQSLITQRVVEWLDSDDFKQLLVERLDAALRTLVSRTLERAYEHDDHDD